MTPNLSHVAGLELASEAVKDYTSTEAIHGAIYRLLNQAKSAPAEVAQGEAVLFSQFLTAVMDAAGLVRHGRQSKELSEYLGKECIRLRLMNSLSAPPSPDAELVELKGLLPALDDALEDLELHGRHSDQGYRKLKDWYRKAAVLTARIDAKLASLVPQ